MKEKVVFAEERKERIMDLLKENDKVFVPEMSDFFGVSPATIRNDLNDLEKQGRLKRTHGGAIAVTSISDEQRHEEKKVKNISMKEEIAQKAAGLIKDGDIVLLDTGTTTYQITQYLQGLSNLTIVTNDIEIAREMEDATSVNVILLGGMVRKGFHCTVGPFTNKLLSAITVDKAFIAANGIDASGGAYTPDSLQAETKELMIQCARESYLVTDSTKIGRKSFVKFADFDKFEAMITDSHIDEAEYQELKEHVRIIN